MSQYLNTLLKATGRAGLDNNQIMNIARTKYKNIDLRMDPNFQRREAFNINDEMVEQTKKIMEDYGSHSIPPKIKARLEDFAAKAIALGDDQQLLRHSNAFLKLADDLYGPGGASNVTSMVPEQLARQAHKNSMQLADSTYGDFPGRQEMIKKNIERLMKEAPGEVEVLRNYLNSGYEGTYAEYLRNEVDPDKWMHYQNVFPEGYGAGDFATGGRVGAAGGGLIRALLKLLGRKKGKGLEELMQPKTPAGNVAMRNLLPDNELDMRMARGRLMEEPGWYRDTVLGESKTGNAWHNLGKATADLTGWKPDPQSPIVMKGIREGFAKPREGIMQTSKIDDEINSMMTEMKAMKERSEKMMLDADFKMRDMKSQEAMVDAFVRDLDDGIDPGTAIKRFTAAYKKLREPHAVGGRVGLRGGGILGRLFRMGTAGDAEISHARMRGPFNTGHSSVDLGDMQQYKNIINDPNVELDAIHELEDMVQNSLRYSKEQKAAFLKLIRKEKFKVNVLYDDAKLQRMAKADPEGFDRWLEYMINKDPTLGDYATGGRVGLHEGGMLGSMGVEDGSYQAAEQAQNPYQQAYKDAANNMTNEDLLNPQVQGLQQAANQRQQFITQRMNERNNDLISRLSPFQVAQQGTNSYDPLGQLANVAGQGHRLSNLPGSQDPVSNRQLGEGLSQGQQAIQQAIGHSHQALAQKLGQGNLQQVGLQQGAQGVSAFGAQGAQPLSTTPQVISGLADFGGQLGIGGLFGMRS
ncbi:MAG: hypothetical protein CL924_00435 [Deltaproteobacteria bacterium]|nr:MAG: hypothetical protein CL924_00435 [Deltaproteobacteria bacterium]